MIEQKYDPQGRPIYPAGSYWGQVADWLDSKPDIKTLIAIIISMNIGVLIFGLLLEWVY